MSQDSDSTPFSTPTKESMIQGPADFEREYPISQLERLQIDLPAAHLLLSSHDQPTIKIRMQNPGGLPALLPEVEVSGNILQVSQRLVPGIQSLIQQKKPHGIEIFLPKTFPISVLFISGSLFLENIAGPLQAEIKFGKISGTYQGENLRAKIYAGAIKLHGLTGQAHVSVGAGNIELLWDALSSKSNVDIRAGLGDIALRFPSKPEPRSILHTGLVRKTVLRSQGDALIFASIEAGNLKVE